MLLNIADRLIALQVLAPLKGTYDETKRKVELIDLLAVKEDEKENLGMRTEENIWIWDDKKDEGKEVDLEKYKDVCEKAADKFKAVHEEKKDWDETLVRQIEHFENLMDGKKVEEQTEKVEEFKEEPAEAPNTPKQ